MMNPSISGLFVAGILPGMLMLMLMSMMGVRWFLDRRNGCGSNAPDGRTWQR